LRREKNEKIDKEEKKREKKEDDDVTNKLVIGLVGKVSK
jgi:hypothetical protein